MQHLFISLAMDLKYSHDVELLYPSDEFQTNWIFYREHKIQKHHFYREANTIKVMVLFFCFSIKDQICLKPVRCFCCYSAATKTSFGICSCSELLQLKFGDKDVAGKYKLLIPQASYSGWLRFQMKDIYHIYNFVKRLFLWISCIVKVKKRPKLFCRNWLS